MPDNKEQKNQEWRKYGIALGAGWIVVSSMAVSVLIGLGLDRLFHTGRLLFIIMFFVGLVAGLYNLIREMRKLE